MGDEQIKGRRIRNKLSKKKYISHEDVIYNLGNRVRNTIITMYMIDSY